MASEFLGYPIAWPWTLYWLSDVWWGTKTPIEQYSFGHDAFARGFKRYWVIGEGRFFGIQHQVLMLPTERVHKKSDEEKAEAWRELYRTLDEGIPEWREEAQAR